jgi:hypothetical protein
LLLACGCLSLAHAQQASLRKTEKPQEEVTGEATPEMIEDEYLRVAKKCGLTVGYTLGGVTATVLSAEETKPFLPRFFAAMDIFPVRFLRETRLHTVVFVRDLKSNGVSAAGLAVSDGRIYLDVTHFNSKVIYHEMFHIADNLGHNESWTKLNSKQFAYGGSKYKPAELDKKTQAKVEAVKSDAELRKDFVSDYAMTHEVEDRAETFAWMVANPKQFAKMAQESPVLEKKAQVVKKIVREFAPAMNKDFWDFIADSDDASRMEDFKKRALTNDQRKKDKKPLLNSGYTK